MESRYQKPLEISSYLPFAAVVLLVVVTISASALSRRARVAGPPQQAEVESSQRTELEASQQAETAVPDQAEAIAPQQVNAGSHQQAEAAAPQQTNGSQDLGTARPEESGRNVAMQPEAFRLSRRVGQRFTRAGREISTLNGALIRGTEQQQLQIIRRQNDRGEKVDIAVNGGPPSLAWSADEGARASGQAPSETERTLIERLVLDSLDQFALAQLRGASYYTVARNVRPAEAGDADNYNGPLWDLVRVDYPEQDATTQPLSRSRIYYLNSATGLIDKIVYEIRNERIEVNFSGWREEGGEAVPARTTWTHEGQSLMEFRVTNFSTNSLQ